MELSRGASSYCYLPHLNSVIAHGGFLPDQPWQEQKLEIITTLQVIDEKEIMESVQTFPTQRHGQVLEGNPSLSTDTHQD